MATRKQRESFSPFRERMHEIIFEADTKEGYIFDVLLLVFIVLSVLIVMLESVGDLHDRYTNFFYFIEWVFTIFFTLEYITRLYCVYKPIRYATSFFGIIDLLAILPAYIALFPFVGGAQSFVVIRILRLLRIFRIFKLAHFLNQSSYIINALRSSSPKITVFLVFVVLIATIIGSFMYLIEGHSNSGFTSIPRSIYWAIVTLTTVGYGDIAPKTNLGQMLAAIVMIMGYAVIAVPTGIVSAEMVRKDEKVEDLGDAEDAVSTQSCKHCCHEGHDIDAVFCKFCGEEL